MKIKQHFLRWVATALLMTLLTALIASPTEASNRSISRQQWDQIAQKLKDRSANATVIIGDSANDPTVISNHVDTKDGKAKPISVYRLFPIASLEKGITGVALQQQFNKGTLSPKTKLSKYLPQVDNSQRITIFHLLTHTSGLADAHNIAPYPIKTTAGNVHFTEHNYRVVNHDPGVWFYANINYGLIAIMISKVTHQSYHQYVEDHIIKANHISGMKFFEQLKSNKDVTPVLVKENFILDPHESNSWRYLQREMSAEYGAGQIMTTPMGYWQFIHRAILDKPEIRNQYRKATHQVKTEPAYYNGFYLKPDELHANGFTDGYTCTVYTNLANRHTFVVFSNNISLQKCRDLAAEINRIYNR